MILEDVCSLSVDPSAEQRYENAERKADRIHFA